MLEAAGIEETQTGCAKPFARLLADLAFETFAKAALRYSMQANAVGGGFARRG